MSDSVIPRIGAHFCQSLDISQSSPHKSEHNDSNQHTDQTKVQVESVNAAAIKIFSFSSFVFIGSLPVPQFGSSEKFR